jgi:hypothetical protein
MNARWLEIWHPSIPSSIHSWGAQRQIPSERLQVVHRIAPMMQ